MDSDYVELIVWDTGLTSISDLTSTDSSYPKESWKEVYSYRYFEDGFVRALDDLSFGFFHPCDRSWHYAVIRYVYSDGFEYEVAKEFFFNGDGK